MAHTTLKDYWEGLYGTDYRISYNSVFGRMNKGVLPEIKKVIYHEPATIVLWEDGTKTVVKCYEGDVFSEEVGLAMCICKKALGDRFHRTFKLFTIENDPFMEKLKKLEEDGDERSKSCRELFRDAWNAFCQY